MTNSEVMLLFKSVEDKVGQKTYSLPDFKVVPSSGGVDFVPLDTVMEPSTFRLRVQAGKTLESVSKLLGVKPKYIIEASEALRVAVVREALSKLGPRSIVYEDYKAFKVIKTILDSESEQYKLATVLRDVYLFDSKKAWAFIVRGETPHPSDFSYGVDIHVGGVDGFGLSLTYTCDSEILIKPYISMPNGKRISTDHVSAESYKVKASEACTVIISLLKSPNESIQKFFKREWRGLEFEQKLLLGNKLLGTAERKRYAARMADVKSEISSVYDMWLEII